MKVIISDTAAKQAITQEQFGQLHELLAHATTGRHLVIFESEVGRDLALATFSESVRPYYARVLDINIRSLGRCSTDAASIYVATGETQWADPLARLPLTHTLRVLSEPLGILLENSENDWNFLRGVMRKTDQDRLLDYTSKGWAVPIHGGGTSLKAILDRRLSDAALGLRTFVMFDSDRMHPDEYQESWKPKSEGLPTATCQAFDWERLTKNTMPHRYWMLKRRFIESYMPLNEIPVASNQTTPTGAAEVFARLPKETQWCYNMKEGISGDSRRSDKHRCKDLYGHLSDDEQSALSLGFGNKLAVHYSNALTRPFSWDIETRMEANEAIPRLIRLL